MCIGSNSHLSQAYYDALLAALRDARDNHTDFFNFICPGEGVVSNLIVALAQPKEKRGSALTDLDNAICKMNVEKRLAREKEELEKRGLQAVDTEKDSTDTK